MKHTLCIDIGGTRIKSAVLPEFPTLDQAKNAPSKVIRTLGWLNHSLPKLVDRNQWGGLASYYYKSGIDYDSVALSVPGAIDEKGLFKRSDLVHGSAKVPEKLLAALKKSADCPVTVIKDADAWMMGFQAYMNARGEKIEHPVILMAFGTGCGISVTSKDGDVMSIEASGRPANSWKQLAVASGYDITEGWHVHKIIGRSFFEFVEKSHKEWDHLKIRREYTKRVDAALDDILPWIEESLGYSVRTCVLAGGNAEYVSVSSLEKKRLKVISLTDRLSSLSPDLITVLGVEASSREPRPKVLQ
jgi:hypothetical protein